MSDEARRLAEGVNKRQADQKIEDELQLHKAGVLRSKGHSFWNNMATVFRQEVTDFNKYLTVDDYQIESFDDMSTPYTIKLHAKSGRSATCVIDIDGQSISLTGQRPGSDKKLHAAFSLVVDREDKIQIRSGSGAVNESESLLRP